MVADVYSTDAKGQFRYTVRCLSTHENLGPASEELAAAYASALQAGSDHVLIHPHSVPRKVYVEHGYTPSNLGQSH